RHLPQKYRSHEVHRPAWENPILARAEERVTRALGPALAGSLLVIQASRAELPPQKDHCRLSRLLSVQQFHLPRPCPPRPRQPVSLCLQSPKDVSAASVEGHPCQVFVRRPRLNNKASPQERSWSVAESLEALQFQRRKVSGFSGVRNLGIKHRRRPTVTSMKSNCGAPPVTSFNIEQ